MLLQHTINPQKRPAGLILSLRVQIQVLLEFGYFCLLFFKFTAGLIRIRVLFEGGSLSRIYGSLNPLVKSEAFNEHNLILLKSGL